MTWWDMMTYRHEHKETAHSWGQPAGDSRMHPYKHHKLSPSIWFCLMSSEHHHIMSSQIIIIITTFHPMRSLWRMMMMRGGGIIYKRIKSSWGSKRNHTDYIRIKRGGVQWVLWWSCMSRRMVLMPLTSFTYIILLLILIAWRAGWL